MVSKTKRRARTRLARVLGVVTAMGLGGIVSTSLQTHAEGPLPFNGPQLQPFGLPQPRPPFPYGLNGSSISPRALSPCLFDVFLVTVIRGHAHARPECVWQFRVRDWSRSSSFFCFWRQQ